MISTSSKQDGELEKREEAKRRILDQYPDISQSTLEFMLSLPVERKIPKVSELESVYASRQQQEEMERLLKKNKEQS